MKYVLETIGVLVLSTVVVAIPILMTVSIFCNWIVILQIIFTLLTLLVWLIIAYSIAEIGGRRRMTEGEAIIYFKQCNSKIVSVCKDENEYDYEKQEIISDCARKTYEANRLALEALEQSLCEDCISREKAVTEINKYHMTSGVTHQCVWNECVRVIAKTIQELSPVTPQPKTGHWIKSNRGRKMIFATDFDGTLCENKFPDIGKPNIKLINYLIAERKSGNEVILYTMREGEVLDKAIEWCKSYGLEFDAVNDNLPRMKKFFKNNPRKVYANTYIDDHNIKGDLANMLPYVEVDEKE